MKFLLLLLIIINVEVVRSQNDSLPELKGALGLTFGCSKQQANTILTQKGGVMDKVNSKNDIIIFDKLKFGVRKPEFVSLKFVNNKLYEINIYFSTMESLTQELYNSVRSDIEKKYFEGECYRNFDGIYHDGDGYEMQAVKLGYAKINCFWTNFKNNTSERVIQLGIDVGLLVVLTYQDTKILEEKIKQNDIKNNQDY
jgi:hypothetical protein